MLNASEMEFLQAVGNGEGQAAYARRNNYSRAWAKWMSRKIRAKLGATTLGEALAMSETASEGVSKSDFDKLVGLVTSLGDAVEGLARAKPADQPAAQQQVQQRELDVKDHAKALGLSMDDVTRIQEEKEYEKYKKMEARRVKELEDEQGETEPQRDGLGGVSNLLARARGES